MYSKYFRLNFLHLSYCSLNRWIRLEISFSSFLSANYACKLLKNNFIAVMCTAKYNLPCRSFASTVSFQKDFFSTKKLIINSLQTRRTHTGSVGNSFLVFVASINVRVLNHWLTFLLPLFGLLFEIMHRAKCVCDFVMNDKIPHLPQVHNLIANSLKLRRGAKVKQFSK